MKNNLDTKIFENNFLSNNEVSYHFVCVAQKTIYSIIGNNDSSTFNLCIYFRRIYKYFHIKRILIYPDTTACS